MAGDWSSTGDWATFDWAGLTATFTPAAVASVAANMSNTTSTGAAAVSGMLGFYTILIGTG